MAGGFVMISTFASSGEKFSSWYP